MRDNFEQFIQCQRRRPSCPPCPPCPPCRRDHDRRDDYRDRRDRNICKELLRQLLTVFLFSLDNCETPQAA